MKKKSDLQRLSANLQSVFTGKKWYILWQTYKLVENWPAIAGKKVAEISMPAYIQKNILWIYVNNSIWMQQLQVEKPRLMHKIKEFHADLTITDIRWLLRPENALETENKETQRREKQINPQEQRDFQSMTSSLHNEECRNALIKLWQAYHKNREL